MLEERGEEVADVVEGKMEYHELRLSYQEVFDEITRLIQDKIEHIEASIDYDDKDD